MTIPDAIIKQPKSWVWAEAIFIILTVGFIDCVTPYQLNMFIFYAFTIFGIGCYAGKKPAVIFALCAATVSLVANWHTQPFHSLQLYIWAVLNRMVGFCFVALCGASIKSHREVSRAQVEALDRTRQLEQEIVRTSEREQMRIGQDLHDGVCQNLAAIDCAMECLKSDLESGGASHATTARVIQKLLKETIVDARNLARGIFPVHMDAEGLTMALNDLVSTTNQLRQASITFEASDHVQIKDPSTAMHLYRIVQEALSNAMRHSHASHVAVHVVRNGYSLTISVADDGCGFSTGPSSKGMGMGLWTMQYRANLIGAKVRIESRAAGGTLVSCAIPVPPASGIFERFDPTRSAARSRPVMANT